MIKIKLSYTSFTVLIVGFITTYSFGQNTIKTYDLERLKGNLDSLQGNFGVNKDLPKRYELQALLALSYYPELTDIKVKFKHRKGGAPFVSRPTVWSTFFKKPHKRTYLILIREKNHPMFDPILLPNMPFDAQVGVLGHELAHTVDFTNRGVFKMINVIFGNLSWKYMDKFEYETDRRAIKHGLGYQLLAWSEHAVKTLRVNEPALSEVNDKLVGILERERYMRPSTIKEEMSKIERYRMTKTSIRKE